MAGLSSPYGLARDSSGKIYVANSCTVSINVYPAGSNGNVAPVAVIGGSNTGLVNPFAVVVDSTGKIYVGDTFSDSVSIFAAGSNGNVAPLAVISGSKTGLAGPFGVAVDSSRNVYVANAIGPSVTVYKAGSTGNVAPLATISCSNTGLFGPKDVAVDSSGNIYVADNRNLNFGIFVYKSGSHGNVSPMAMIGGSNAGLTNPLGIAVDSNRNIYVTNADPAAYSVKVFAAGSNGNVAPMITISGANTELGFPKGIALDPSRDIYVSNNTGGSSQRGSVTVYLAGNKSDVSPIAAIADPDVGHPRPHGVGLDSAGKIYVSSGDFVSGFPPSVAIYPAGSNADVLPIAIITGSNTGLNYPDGVVIDAKGKIFVTDFNNNTIAIFAAGAKGNVTPVATIEGSNTGLDSPAGIALDSSGNLYVANETHRTDSITVYAAGSKGNAAPTSVLFPCSRRRFDVKVDSAKNIYVACAEGAVNTFAPGSGFPLIASIAGSNTGLGFPTGIALDSKGKIYVANTTGNQDSFNNSILVFAAHSNGNVAPIATITGPHTLLGAVGGIAIRESSK